jgi:hypothetical protein
MGDVDIAGAVSIRTLLTDSAVVGKLDIGGCGSADGAEELSDGASVEVGGGLTVEST